MTSAKLDLPWREVSGYHCFGCCPENAAGLALAPTIEGDQLVCRFVPDRRHESYPGVVHGGIAMTVLDELMGNALMLLHSKACFTVSMRVRFLSPLRTKHTYRAVARIVEVPAKPDGLYRVEGELLDEQNQEVFTASANYSWMTEEQAQTAMEIKPFPSASLARYLR